MRDFHLDLNLRPRFGGSPHGRFIELSAQRIALAFNQRAHLLMQCLLTLLETLLNLLNLRLLFLGQIEFVTKMTEGSKASRTSRFARTSRPTTSRSARTFETRRRAALKSTLSRRMWRARLL